LDEETPHIDIPLAWIGAEELPVHLVNQFVCQFHQDEFILTLGQMVPPALIAPTPEERRTQAEQVSYVPIKPLARVAFTRQRLIELVNTLQANIDQYDEFQRQQDPRMKGGDEI
jgi:hypothetical protein